MKEALEILFGCTKFRDPINGMSINVTTDHKLIEIIHKKNIYKNLKRLQRMLYFLNSYDINVKWKPGN